jgi:hypothetical protein
VGVRNNWTIPIALQKDMEQAFESHSALHRILDTNPKTWGKIVNRTGVKKTTAQSLVMNFFQLLNEIYSGVNDDNDIRRDFAKRLFEEKYEDDYLQHEYEKYLVYIISGLLE